MWLVFIGLRCLLCGLRCEVGYDGATDDSANREVFALSHFLELALRGLVYRYMDDLSLLRHEQILAKTSKHVKKSFRVFLGGNAGPRGVESRD